MSTLPVTPAPSPQRNPNHPWEIERAPSRGGGRRFAIALIVTFAVLASVVVGLVYWMKVTSHADYKGPEKLKPPEHPYYRY